ncbi:MAG TPA: hypothetical protein VK209_12065 [Candidatus Sulfotelmatobacter sp.]|nr:hypothetical protein [Candidatus Sulfotelmatobacter sp.]
MSTPKPVIVAKARLTNFGNGMLEISDNTLRFYTEAGRFKKQRKNIHEIPLKEIESAERQGNDLTITWKENMNTFIVAQTSQVDAIYERINTKLTEEKKEIETEKTAIQAQADLTQTTSNFIETIYSLFTLLKQLHGQVNWKNIENDFKMIDEDTAKLANQNPDPIKLDTTQLQLTIQEHRPKEIAENTYDILKTLHEHFDELPLNEDLEKPHPNNHDLKLIIQASYILNDIALGVAVGDEANEKETKEFIKVLEDLAKLPSAKIDVASVKSSLEKFSTTKSKQTEIFDEIRLKVEQQIKEVMKPQQATIEQRT